MKSYFCPMHPEVEQGRPGHCPKCGMDLIVKGDTYSESNNKNLERGREEGSYTPLFIIIGLIVLVTVILAVKSNFEGQFSRREVMMNFMAGFFLVFSGFKLMDIKGFAQGYSTYDLLAKRVFNYGYLYPLIELSLGLLFVLHLSSPLLNLFTVVLMTFSGLGVAIKLLKHQPIQCACLGTFLKVPLTKVTLIEDFGMALMALLMLI